MSQPHKPSLLERLSTIPKIPVPAMSAMPPESFIGGAAIAEAAHIALSASPSSDDATSTMPKEKSSASITGAADPAESLKNANTSWDNSSRPSPVRILPPHGPSHLSSTNWGPHQLVVENDLALTRQMNWSLAQEAGQTEATLPVELTLPMDLWTHLLAVADGRGQSVDEMLSERVQEFRDLYGLI